MTGVPAFRRVLAATAAAGLGVACLLTVTVPSATADASSLTWYLEASGTTANLHAVRYLPGASGSALAVGDGGTVLKTTDNGVHWSRLDAGTTEDLYAVGADVDDGSGCDDGSGGCVWVAGDDGTIRFSADGGGSWCAQNSGTDANLHGIYASVFGVKAVGADGVVVAGGDGYTIDSSTGCGLSYTADDTGTDANLNSVTGFSAGQFGYVQAVGSGGSLIEENTPWQPVTTGTTATLYGSGLLQSNDGQTNEIAIGGAGGFFARDTVDPDDGTPGAFTTENTGTSADLRALAFPFSDSEADSAVNDVVAVGDSGTIDFRNGADATWSLLDSPTDANLTGIDDENDDNALIVGEHGTIVGMAQPLPGTTLSVTPSQDATASGDPVTLTATLQWSDDNGLPDGTIQFYDGDAALGDPQPATYSPRGEDAGASLTTSSLTSGAHEVSAVYSGGDNYGASVSDPISLSVDPPPGSTVTVTSLAADHATIPAGGGAVTLTASVSAAEGTPSGRVTFTDGGIELGKAKPLSDGSASLTIDAFDIGAHHLTATYSGDPTDARSTSPDTTVTVTPRSWHAENSPTTQNLHAVTYFHGDTQHALAVGDHGTILRSSDGGESWTSETSGTTASLNAIDESALCGDQPCIWVAGDHGTILYSSDGGSHWCEQASGTTADLDGVTDLDPNDILAGGSGGTVVRGGGFTKGCSATYSTVPHDGGADLRAMGYLLGTTGVGAAGSIDRLTGNSHFSTVDSGTTTDLYALAELDSQDGQSDIHGVVAGAGGYAATADLSGSGPGTFTAEDTGTTSDLHALAVGDYPSASDLASPDLWAVGDHGSILFRDTSSATPTWTTLASPTTADLAGVAYGDVTHGLVVGAGGTILTEIEPPTTVATTTSVATSRSTVLPGGSVALTAQVSAASGTPTGSVRFTDDGADLGSALSLGSDGSATLNTSSLPLGSHTIAAAYPGTAGFAASASASVTVTVAKAASALKVVAAPKQVTTATTAMSVSVTVTTASGASVDGGTVSLSAGSTPLGSATVSNGKAAVRIAGRQSAGRHTWTVDFGGTPTAAAQRVTYPLTVTKVASRLRFATKPAALKHTVRHATATVTVTAPGASINGAKVTISGQHAPGTARISRGKATFKLRKMPKGRYHWTVRFAGTSTAAAKTVLVTFVVS